MALKAIQSEKTMFERVPTLTFENAGVASVAVAREIADLIKERQSENKNVVLNDTKIINRVVAKNKNKNTTIKKVLLNTFLKNVPDTFLSPTLSNVELNARSIKNSIENNRQNVLDMRIIQG